MKAIICSLIMIIGLAAGTMAQRDRILSLRSGQQKTAGGGLVVKFVAVTEDSRCPSNVNCVWAGVGRVKISLRKDGKTGEFELNTNQTDKSATFEGYIISLSALDPYPSGKPIAKGRYTARFNIRKIER